jgi:predicted deacylase
VSVVKKTRAKANNKTITIGATSVAPGERVVIDLPVADLYTHAAMYIPVQVINGRMPGPTLFVCAAIHGDELNGVEIIRRLTALKVMSRLHGALIAVPIVNVHGFINQSRYLPDRRDLNRSFPGTPKGSVAARLAHTFAQEVIEKSDYGIDIHTGAIHRSNLPQVRANLDDKETLSLAEVFNVPVLINAPVRDGSLRGYAAEKGIPTLLYEAGEALRFDEVGIRAGLRGVTSVMRKLGMLPRKKTESVSAKPLVATTSSWVRAPISGIMRSEAKLGQRVTKGETLVAISDPFGDGKVSVPAPFAGIVIGKTNLPLALEGDALMHIARFDSVALAEDKVEEFRSDLLPLDPGSGV